jgi:murein tripeptide amidase MpaA
MPDIKFDRYYRYDELTNLLQDFAETYPNLVQLESIGKSYEGRYIWVLAVTNFDTGSDKEKPALWVDGNIHSAELSGSTACLYHLHTLIEGYGNDEQITRCLDTRVTYICPRINPDGAEWALADIPRFVRSSTRPYPYLEDPVEGLTTEDIDGDGRVLTMRVPDPNGTWKTHPDEPRLMVHRDPVEVGGTYYRLLPEGRLTNYDGFTINILPPKEGLDLNRNFPMEWKGESEQKGAGPYPTSEPEIRAVVDFITVHNNIGSTISFHTYSGVLLRPYASQADDALPAEDLWTYQKVGEKGTEITGYPNISIFHDFKYHPKQVITGGFDWTYDHLGMFMWAVEIWAPMREAGIEDYKFIDWFREHPVEDDFKILQWVDGIVDGGGYVDWYPFDHPELGEVELGGIDFMRVWRNPPVEYLEKEVSKFTSWLTWQALISPKLEIRDLATDRINADTFKIRLVLENRGWLPTYVTKKALEKQVVRGVICEIEIPESATLETGLPREEFGQLEGRAYKTASLAFSPLLESTTDRIKLEWVINAPKGGEVKLTARHDRAGTVRTTVNLI